MRHRYFGNLLPVLVAASSILLLALMGPASAALLTLETSYNAQVSITEARLTDVCGSGPRMSGTIELSAPYTGTILLILTSNAGGNPGDPTGGSATVEFRSSSQASFTIPVDQTGKPANTSYRVEVLSANPPVTNPTAKSVSQQCRPPVTATATMGPTASPTGTPTSTPTSTPVASTPTPASTPTATPLGTQPSATSTPTDTLTGTPTETPVAATSSPAATPVAATSTPASTPAAATATSTTVPTPQSTPSVDDPPSDEDSPRAAQLPTAPALPPAAAASTPAPIAPAVVATPALQIASPELPIAERPSPETPEEDPPMPADIEPPAPEPQAGPVFANVIRPEALPSAGEGGSTPDALALLLVVAGFALASSGLVLRLRGA